MNLSNSMFDVSVIYRFSGESSTIVTDLDRYDASTLLFSGDLRQLPQLAPIGVALKEKIFLSVIFLSVVLPLSWHAKRWLAGIDSKGNLDRQIAAQ